MDTYPKTKFISSAESEANRILHSAVQIANGFYFNHRFAVLPYLKANNPSTVHFPALNYTKIPHLFEELSNTKDVIPLDYPPQLVKQIKDLLPKETEITQVQVRKFEKEWLSIQEEFWQFLNEIFPEHIKNIEVIEVRITHYGTKMSYGRIYSSKVQCFPCYIRSDMAVANIGEAIIQTLLHVNKDYSMMNWEERESIADFLIQRLVEKKVFKKYNPTIAPLKKQSEDLLKKSTEYMASLGLHFEKPFKKENSLIYLNNIVISAKLTSIQHLILSLLIDKQNQVVTYDELGGIIWIEDSNFSIWAINKNIQRLRTKLKSLGAKLDCITPIKGKGYCLNNI